MIKYFEFKNLYINSSFLYNIQYNCLSSFFNYLREGIFLLKGY